MMAIHWNIDCEDWRYGKSNPEKIFDIVAKKLPDAGKCTSGPIILQHDSQAETIPFQSKIFDFLKNKGYSIVTIEKCISSS